MFMMMEEYMVSISRCNLYFFIKLLTTIIESTGTWVFEQSPYTENCKFDETWTSGDGNDQIHSSCETLITEDTHDSTCSRDDGSSDSYKRWTDGTTGLNHEEYCYYRSDGPSCCEECINGMDENDNYIYECTETGDACHDDHHDGDDGDGSMVKNIQEAMIVVDACQWDTLDLDNIQWDETELLGDSHDDPHCPTVCWVNQSILQPVVNNVLIEVDLSQLQMGDGGDGQ